MFYEYICKFDLHEIFNNFSYDSFDHFITGDTIYFKVSIYD